MSAIEKFDAFSGLRINWNKLVLLPLDPFQNPLPQLKVDAGFLRNILGDLVWSSGVWYGGTSLLELHMNIYNTLMLKEGFWLQILRYTSWRLNFNILWVGKTGGSNTFSFDIFSFFLNNGKPLSFDSSISPFNQHACPHFNWFIRSGSPSNQYQAF